ncbi:MAG TPA: DUF1156 domain-containing protein [Armatimonadetes bacterium]|nr:DUF1156 domain-containing protein [Armatimonadota bacterium]
MDREKFIPNLYVEETINKLAQEELGKRQYYRPVYSLHKWWARRPGALFRSLILLATYRDAAYTPFVPRANHSLSEKSDYFQSHDLSEVIILDPFMGGGTTLIEGSRLGAKVIGCDINPVSFWIVRETLKPIDIDKLEAYFRQLECTAGERIRALYRTTCATCNAASGGLYSFWVRYVRCPGCGEDVYLFKRTLLNAGVQRNKPISHRNPATVFCPQCHRLNEWYGAGPCSCRQCSLVFDPREGTYNQGYYRCPHCGREQVSLIQTLKAGQRLREKLVAIEYWCPYCQDRLYKSPDPEDWGNLAEIERTFEEVKERLIFPRQPILEGASSVRWRRHKYHYYYEVFNARQLLAFNYLIEAIQAIPEEEYRYAFFTVFSNSLEYNNMMTPYNYPHRKLHHLFNYHAMPLTTTPVENAVWGVAKEGAGTFVNCYHRYVRAKRFCQRPFDKFKDSRNTVRTVYAEQETITPTLVSSFEELERSTRGALLLCGDSANLPTIPDKSVDFVITDPPYSGNIHYSELSNFFYVWLKLLVDHPAFTADHVPTEREAIVNEGMGKGEEHYRVLLTSVFKECRRVLKDEGWLIFTFHHTKWQAWWTTFIALMESGFHITDSFPVRSEYKVNPHVRNKQALDVDLVLVCQKRLGPSGAPSLSPNEAVQKAMGNLPPRHREEHQGKLFVRFMGELLKEASSVWATGGLSYEWFAEALTHFDDLTATVHRAPGVDTEDPRARQLQLF